MQQCVPKPAERACFRAQVARSPDELDEARRAAGVCVVLKNNRFDREWFRHSQLFLVVSPTESFPVENLFPCLFIDGIVDGHDGAHVPLRRRMAFAATNQRVHYKTRKLKK